MSCDSTYTEFVIQDEQKAKVLRDPAVLARIDTLFGVRVVLPTARHGQREWVSVRGPPENTDKAKRYVLALCTPEFQAGVKSKGRFSQLLFGENSRLRDDLEREYQTVVQPSPSGIRVQGKEFFVSLTVSRLASLKDTMDNGGYIRENVAAIRHDPQLPNSDLNQELMGFIQQMDSDSMPSTIEKLTDSVKLALLEGLRTQALTRGGDGSSPLPVVSRDCGQTSVHEISPKRERKFDYFLQLGYPREKIEAVLDSLGSDATDDAILERLVRVSRPPSADAHRSSQRLNISRPRGYSGEPLMSASVPVKDPSTLRAIVIDGSNVAMRHGNGHVFSCKGILLAVEWFRKRGHQQVTVFVPSWRKEPSRPESPIMDQDILHELEKEGCLVFTPSRRIGNKRIVCYDDRFILHLAAITEGVIVSNDNYRDLIDENQKWRVAIEQRLLMFAFVNDIFMVPEDPLGRHGPRLEEMLQMDPRTTQTRGASPEKPQVKVCPYGDRCTFGRKCRFYHPEREPKEPSSGSRTPSRSTTPTPERRVKEDARCMGSAEDVRLGDYSTPQPEIEVHAYERSNPKSGSSTPQQYDQQPVESHPPPHYRPDMGPSTTTGHPRPPFLNLPPPADQFPPSASGRVQSSPAIHRSPLLELPSGTPLEGVSNPYSVTYPLANLHPSSAVRHGRGVTEELYTLSTSTHHSVPSQPPPRSHLPLDVEQRTVYLSRDSHSASKAGQTHLSRDPNPVAVTPVPHHPSRDPSPHPHSGFISRDSDPTSSSSGGRQYTSLSDQRGYGRPQVPFEQREYGYPQQPYYGQLSSYRSRGAEVGQHGRLPHHDLQQPYQMPHPSFARDYSSPSSLPAVPPTVGPRHSMGYARDTVPTPTNPYSSTEHVYSHDRSDFQPARSGHSHPSLYPLSRHHYHTYPNPNTRPPSHAPNLAQRRASVCDRSRSDPEIQFNASRRASQGHVSELEWYKGGNFDKKLFDQAVVVLPGCEERIRRAMREYPSVTELVHLVELVRSLD